MSAPVTPLDPTPSSTQRAEELLLTLPGVIAARVIPGQGGAIAEVHLLTTMEVSPKQTVRNVESALLAHLGIRVDHRKISVATTVDHKRIAGGALAGTLIGGGEPELADAEAEKRRVYFEDVEVRRSRARGVTCRVTLRKAGETFIGEAEGPETERSRAELAARATLVALAQMEELALAIEGVRMVDAFEREFVFVGVNARLARDHLLLTGSCEIRDSVETASALAVLDATNRWMMRKGR
jgi:hypothetical protein